MMRKQNSRCVAVAHQHFLSSLQAVLPHPAKSNYNLIFGVLKRSCRPLETMDVEYLEFFASFVRRVIHPKLRARAKLITTDFDARDWIMKMNKPGTWKANLIDLMEDQGLWDPFAEICNILRDDRENLQEVVYSIFQKEEFYGKITAVRVIFSLTDRMRILFGDVCKKIGHELIECPHIFSGVPVDQWAEIIWKMFPDYSLVYASDYSAFEKFFSRFIKELVDYTPYSILAENSPVFTKKLAQLKADESERLFRCRAFSFEAVEEINRSGSLKTYDINTFGHLVVAHFFNFICTGKLPEQAPIMDQKSVADRGMEDKAMGLSGDDRVEMHARKEDVPSAEMLRKIGLEVEYLEGDKSFCKTEVAEEGGVVRKAAFDFWDVLLKLPWITGQYRKHSKIASLLKAKCISALYNNRSVPIINKICKLTIRQLRSYDHRVARRSMNAWDLEKFDCILSNGFEVYQEPRTADFERLSDLIQVPVDELRRIHDSLDVLSTLEVTHVGDLSPYLPAGYKLVHQIYCTDSDQSEFWTPPCPTRNIAQELKLLCVDLGCDRYKESNSLIIQAMQTSL